MKAENFLIINLGGIGDLLLSTPALKALRCHFPQARICLLAVSQAEEFIKELSFIDDSFNFYKKISFLSSFKNIFTLLKLRKMNFDLAINMRTLVSKMSAQEIKFLLDIIRPKIKAGRDTEGRGDFFDIKISETDIGHKYEMEYDNDIVEALGAKVLDRSVDLEINKESVIKVNALLESENICDNDIVVGVHLGGHPAHRWPVENFCQAINNLQRKISCNFMVTGNNKEAFLAKRLRNLTKAKVIDYTGRLNFKELVAFIKRCNLFISNDTGPMHIAAVLKTPLVAIFGPGYLTRFDPRNISEEAIVLYKKVECAPCNRVTCSSLACLKAISAQKVSEAALKLLELE